MPLVDIHLLNRLVAELDALDDRPDAARRCEDLNYTLCVSTGVRDPREALAHARRLLATARKSSRTANA